jgi:hypothetical protein
MSKASLRARVQLILGVLCLGIATQGCHGKSNQGPLSTISGTALRHVLLGGGVTDAPEDLLFANPTAYFPDADGGWELFTGNGDSNGNFDIVSAPQGIYYLSLYDTSWVATTARTVDLGYYGFGRANLMFPDPGTQLLLDAGSMTAWQTTDDVELISEAAGLTQGSFSGPLAYGLIAQVDAGATVYQQSIDYTGLVTVLGNGGLIALGDQTFLSHLVTQAPAPSVLLAKSLAEAVSTSTLNMINQGYTTLAADFVRPDAGGTFGVTVKRSLFTSYLSAINPKVASVGLWSYLEAYPETTQYGAFAGAPDLVDVELLVTEADGGQSDVSLGVPYQNPYPTNWPLIVQTELSATVRLLLPGVDAGYLPVVGLIGTTDVLQSSSQGEAPLISPVTQPKINGQDFFGGVFLNGATAVVSWSAPALGTASIYTVQFYRADQGASPSIVTTATSVQVPPTVLQPGIPYVAVIRAYAYPNPTLPGPYYSAMPVGLADAVSGIIQP